MPRKNHLSDIGNEKATCAYCHLPIEDHTPHTAIACATSILEKLENV